jgi:hypothetical protein
MQCVVCSARVPSRRCVCIKAACRARLDERKVDKNGLRVRVRDEVQTDLRQEKNDDQ